MTITTIERNKIITYLLNGTHQSLKSIVPMPFQMSKPSIIGKGLELEFGVLIGVTGDVKGSIILSGNRDVFSSIGESMFGMPIDGDMLDSFSGELGNMLAGGISTIIVENHIQTDITAPTIMSGNAKLSGYEQAIQLTAAFENVGELIIYLLLN